MADVSRRNNSAANLKMRLPRTLRQSGPQAFEGTLNARTASPRGRHSWNSARVKAGWLDAVLATPIVGVRSIGWLGTPDWALQALEKLGGEWAKQGGVQLQLMPERVRADRRDGLYFDVAPQSVIVGWTQPVSVAFDAGGAPRLETPEIVPFSSRIDEVLAVFEALLAPRRTLHGVDRIGVVADCRLAAGNEPPGVEQVLGYLTRPWRRVAAVDATVLTVLEETATERVQCHHKVSTSELERPQDIGMKLDWQRVLTKPAPMDTSALARRLKSDVGNAVKYFLEYGQGEVFDEGAG